MTRDSQRSRVYLWQWAYVPDAFEGVAPPMTLGECQGLVDAVWARIFAPSSVPPTVYDGRGRRSAAGNMVRLDLPRWARKRPTVLHELTHAILARRHRYYGGPKPAAHGPEFVRIFCELLARYHCPKTGLRKLFATARAARVKVARADTGLEPMAAQVRAGMR